MTRALLIFAKNAWYGKVKTRLAATIGSDNAMMIYQQLLQHTAAITCDIPVEKYLFYSDEVERHDVWDLKVYHKHLQEGNDLGERMHNAFAYAYREGKKEVVIIGTDCYEITASIIIQAFDHLKYADVVIGPAKDGGYYLLAMKQLFTPLFCNIKWSTSKVLQQTLAACAELSLTVKLLPQLSDTDTEKDLTELQRKLLQIK